MRKLDEITIADLMPDSISQDAQVSATARAINPQLRLVSEAAEKPLILYSIDDLSAGVLEHLAVQYDVTTWDSGWSIETKRAVLKTAIADKRKKGTRGAVQRAIEAVAPVATITEWWQADPPETPHTFRIDVLQDGSAVDAETQADVIAQVNEAKPVRSHFTFNVGQLLGGDLYLAGVLRAIAYARVRDSGIVLEQMGIRAGILAAMRGMSIRHILAETEMGEMPEPTPSSDTLELLLGFRNTGSGWEAVQPISSRNFWAGILSENDHYEAEKFGLQVHSNSSYAGPIGSIVIDYTFGVELLAVYTDSGGSNPVDKGVRWSFVAVDATSTPLIYMSIKNSFLFEPNVRTYRAKFTKHNSADITVYFTSSGGVSTSWSNGATKNVYWGGEYVLFQNGKTYTLIGVYNDDTLLSGVDITTTNNSTNQYMTRIILKNNSGASISRATRAVIRVTNLQTDEREAWFNADKSDYTLSSSYRGLYSDFGLPFVENMERRFDVVRFEDANGNVVTPSAGSLYYFTSGTYGAFRFRLENGTPAFTAAKIVYRSLPTTNKAWLNTSHTGKNLNAYTVYPLYDEAGNRPSELSVTSGALLGLYDENGNEISFSSSQDTVTNSGGYLGLYIGNQAHSNVAFIIYKES